MARRLTTHSSRVVCAKHNDRNYDITKADNIHADKMSENIYWNCYNGYYTETEKAHRATFEQAERAYYKTHFSEMYNEQMSKHKEKRNYSRVKTFDSWRNSKRYAPEEMIIYLGDRDNALTRDEFVDAAADVIEAVNNYSREHNNCYQVIDVAMHFDEAAPHLQIRGVWQYADGNVMRIGQEEALKRAGVELPAADKPEGRYNNRKMTYTRELRERIFDICEQHNISIERTPDPERNRDKRKQNLSKQEYAIQDNTKRIAQQEALMHSYEQYKQQLQEREQALCVKERKLSMREANARRLSEIAEEQQQQAKEMLLRVAQEQKWYDTQQRLHVQQLQERMQRMQDITDPVSSSLSLSESPERR